MKKVVLYGAGKWGSYVAEKFSTFFSEKEYTLFGFLDSDPKKVNTLFCKKPVLSLDDVKNTDDLIIVITMADESAREKVKQLLKSAGFNTNVYGSIDEFLPDCISKTSFIRDHLASYHENAMNPWFESAESEKSLQIFWSENSTFYKMFCTLNLDNVVELACGRGRHVPQYIKKAGSITLVDILEKNINICRERFKQFDNIRYYVNNGYDLSSLESNSQTSLFTYDAMVHFELLDIYNYLKETYRILKPGGKALFHHSNNSENYKISFMTGTHGRNFCSKMLFAHLADRSGFSVTEQVVIDWGGAPELDCITLVEKKV